MKKVIVGLASLGLMAGSVVGASPALAGSLSSGGITVTWDDSRFFVPNGCSSYNFTVQTNGQVNVGNLDVVSRFGDKLGSAVFFDSYSNRTPTVSQETVQICGRPDQTQPLELILKLDVAQYVGAGGDIVAEAPLILQARQAPAPAPTAAPAPAPSAANPKTVKCISKKTFKKKTFKGVTRCPKGWVKI